MKKIMVLLCFFCMAQLNYGQNIEIGSNGIKYNSQLISMQSTQDEALKVFGEPDQRLWLPASYAWTYNRLGIKIGFNPSTKLLYYVDACYTICDFKQCPTSVFSGTILLYGKTLTKTTPINSFKGISEIKFDGTNNDYITVASIPGAKICWSKSGKAGEIESFSISF